MVTSLLSGQAPDAGSPLRADGATKPKEEDLETKPGMISGIKNLYQTKPDARGRSTWVTKYPDDLEEAAENAETARYALLIRNKKCYDGRKKLQIDSIIVQSPLLKGVLGKVLKGYPGVTTTLDRLTFQAPFEPFVHRWTQFSAAVQTEGDSETKAHLDLFHKTLELELQDAIKARDDFILNKVITYDSCWMIFEPGCIVFAVEDKQKVAVRLKSGAHVQTKCGNAYRLSCEYVDWDGETFGMTGATLNIWEFRGTAKITSLSAFPLEYHPAVDKVKEDLVRRGKLFQKLSGYHYKHYQGIGSAQGPWGPIKYNVSCLQRSVDEILTMSLPRSIAVLLSTLMHGTDSIPTVRSPLPCWTKSGECRASSTLPTWKIPTRITMEKPMESMMKFVTPITMTLGCSQATRKRKETPILICQMGSYCYAGQL